MIYICIILCCNFQWDVTLSLKAPLYIIRRSIVYLIWSFGSLIWYNTDACICMNCSPKVYLFLEKLLVHSYVQSSSTCILQRIIWFTCSAKPWRTLRATGVLIILHKLQYLILKLFSLRNIPKSSPVTLHTLSNFSCWFFFQIEVFQPSRLHGS